MNFFLACFLLLSSNVLADEPIRVGFASQDFGNWHFCGTKENHKPFCEPGDQVQGFNAEIALELFQRLELPYTTVFKKWESNEFLEGLGNSEYDVLISNVGFKESRRIYGIYSSQPYESLDALPDYHFFAKRSEQMTLKKVGVAKDSLLHSFLSTLFKPEVITPYNGPDKLIDGLMSGEVDAIFASFSGYREWICANPQIVKLSTIPTSLNVGGINDDTYIITAKRLPGLATRIDQALNSMHSDGTVTRLFDKWIKEKPSCEE